MFREMMLRASVHWKYGIDSSIWHMATTYATYIYIYFPDSHGIAPAGLFSRSHFPRHRLKGIHTWGWPVYVLDPTLGQGKKSPKWQSISRKGIIVLYLEMCRYILKIIVLPHSSISKYVENLKLTMLLCCVTIYKHIIFVCLISIDIWNLVEINWFHLILYHLLFLD